MVTFGAKLRCQEQSEGLEYITIELLKFYLWKNPNNPYYYYAIFS